MREPSLASLPAGPEARRLPHARRSRRLGSVLLLGVALWPTLVLALDPINPQTAARFVPPLGRWRRTEPVRAALMRAELERIAAAPKLSRDTYEQVSRSLG